MAEPLNSRAWALRLLREAGYLVKWVVRVESAGDAGAVATEVLFVTPANRARRAYILERKGKTAIWTKDGWALPTEYDEVGG